MKLSGSDILLECLLEQDVKYIFGFPGGKVLNIYDSIYKYKDRIKHILASHEQHASHAADGYARASGKVGVCLATSGPGATNMVTGIANAYLDSIPMVAITGNVPTTWLGKDSFQEVDIAGVTMPITKHNFIVKDVKDLAHTIRRAFQIAQEGRPGPVLIDIPQDVSQHSCEYEKSKPYEIRSTNNKPNKQQVDKALELISSAKRPFILAGGGVISSNASAHLKEFTTKLHAPIALSAMGMGAIDADFELFTGMIGMHGSKASNMACTECDLLISIGARFSDRIVSNISKFAPSAQILQIDIDPAEISKNVPTYHSLIGDISVVLKEINLLLTQQFHEKWVDYILKIKKEFPLQYSKNGDLKPQWMMEQINELTGGKAIIVTEVGQHQMWACQYIKHKYPRHFLTSGGLGTMGFGLGAAIGAYFACPEKIIINIAGDGCFRMNNIELATLAQYNIPVITIILNNHVLGMVRQWQDLFYGKRFSETDLHSPINFVKVAQAHQVEAYKINTNEEFITCLQKAIASKKPTVLDCEIDKDEKVYPMVPGGAGINELILE